MFSMNPPAIPTPNVPQLSEIDIAIARDRLQWLKICYYVYGGMTVLISCIFIIHFSLFTVFAVIGLPVQPSHPAMPHHEVATEPTTSEEEKNQELREKALQVRDEEQKKQAAVFHMIFGFMACAIGLLMVMGWTMGGFMIYAGRCIEKRKRKTLIQVMAVICCIFIPIGTFLGVVTFLAFSTPAVKAEF